MFLFLKNVHNSYCLNSCHKIESSYAPLQQNIANILYKIIPTDTKPTLVHFINVNWCNLPPAGEFSTILITAPNNKSDLLSHRYQFTSHVQKFKIPKFLKSMPSAAAPFGFYRIIHLQIFPSFQTDEFDEISRWLQMYRYRLRYTMNPFLQNDRLFNFGFKGETTGYYEASNGGYHRPFDVQLNIEPFWTLEYILPGGMDGFGHDLHWQPPYHKVYVFFKPTNKTVSKVPYDPEFYLKCEYTVCSWRNYWLTVSSKTITKIMLIGYQKTTKVLDKIYVRIQLTGDNTNDSPENKLNLAALNSLIPLNATLVLKAVGTSDGYTYEYLYRPGIVTNNKWAPTVITDLVATQFFCCDGGYIKTRVSFYGFISAFDAPTWIFVITLVLLLSMVYSLQVKQLYKNSQTIAKYFQIMVHSVLGVIRMFLYQGSEISSSQLKLPVQLWTVCMFLLGYFYLGDNIGELTAPKSYVRFTKFDEILDRNYTLMYAHDSDVIPSLYEDHYWNQSDFNKDVYDFISHAKFGYSLNPIVKAAILSKTKEDKMFQRLKSAQTEVVWINTTNAAHPFRTLRSHYSFEEFCDKHAILEWSDKITYMENIILQHNLKVFPKRHPIYSRSEKSLFSHPKGWIFLNWGDPWIMLRCSCIWHSGIFEHLKRLFRLKQDSAFRKALSQSSTGDEIDSNELIITLNGNTVVIFMAYGIGLVLSSVMVGFECNSKLKVHFRNVRANLLVQLRISCKYCLNSFKPCLRFKKLIDHLPMRKRE